MGPELRDLSDRAQHLLSHSGERIGGNDFDIGLALAGIMPELGINSFLKSGKPMPVNAFYQAVAINKINEQNEFYSAENQRFLNQLVRDSKQPEQVKRLLKVQAERLSYLLIHALCQLIRYPLKPRLLNFHLSSQVISKTHLDLLMLF